MLRQSGYLNLFSILQPSDYFIFSLFIFVRLRQNYDGNAKWQNMYMPISVKVVAEHSVHLKQNPT